MLLSILIALDGSEGTTAAVDFAVGLAGRAKAELTGIGIVDELAICRPEPVPIGGIAMKIQRDQALVAEARRRRVEQSLDDFSRRCADAGVAFKTIADVGLPAEQTMIEAQRHDVVVLPQRAHFSFRTHERADEMLAHAVKNSPRPVVVVPQRWKDKGAVVVAYDGSLQAARTLQAFQAVQLDTSTVHVVTVHEDQGEAEQRADRAIDYLKLHNITARRHAIGSPGNPAELLLERSKRLEAGLIVMGAYGQPALREFFLGSVTRKLLAESSIPLFLYH